MLLYMFIPTHIITCTCSIVTFALLTTATPQKCTTSRLLQHFVSQYSYCDFSISIVNDACPASSLARPLPARPAGLFGSYALLSQSAQSAPSDANQLPVVDVIVAGATGTWRPSICGWHCSAWRWRGRPPVGGPTASMLELRSLWSVDEPGAIASSTRDLLGACVELQMQKSSQGFQQHRRGVWSF